jgi:flagellar hook-length control protein FliK
LTQLLQGQTLAVTTDSQTANPSAIQQEGISLTPLTTSTAGKDFPSVMPGEERISTQALLRSMSQEMFGVENPEGVEEAPISWRTGLTIGAEPASQPSLQALVQASGMGDNAPRSLVTLAMSSGQTSRLAASTLLTRPDVGQTAAVVGTLSANRSADWFSVPSRSLTPDPVGTVARAGLILSTSQQAESLQGAQQAILRRAAHTAFLNENAGKSAQVVGTATVHPLGTEAFLREVSRSAEVGTESLVRTERSRSRTVFSEAPARSASSTEWSSVERTVHAGAQAATPPVTTPAPTTAMTAAPQAYAPLMEHIAQEARRQVRLGKREFRIQLNPEALGSVELEVVWDDDVLTVRFKAASEQSQRILEDHITELEQALNQQGFGMDTTLPWRETEDAESAVAGESLGGLFRAGQMARGFWGTFGLG